MTVLIMLWLGIGAGAFYGYCVTLTRYHEAVTRHHRRMTTIMKARPGRLPSHMEERDSWQSVDDEMDALRFRDVVKVWESA